MDRAGRDKTQINCMSNAIAGNIIKNFDDSLCHFIIPMNMNGNIIYSCKITATNHNGSDAVPVNNLKIIVPNEGI
jgi:hypothetical protein